MMFTKSCTVDCILDGLHKIRMGQARILCDAGVDVIADWDDIGIQKRMISSQMWRRFLKPRYAELARLCHRKGAFFFHNDGWIELIIPNLTEIDVDIQNPNIA